MNELERWGTRSLSHRRTDRAVDKATTSIAATTRVNGVKLDAMAALTARAMERTVDVDDYRRALAGVNEELNGALVRIEMAYLTSAERILRRAADEMAR